MKAVLHIAVYCNSLPAPHMHLSVPKEVLEGNYCSEA